jgi:hypothetical protein
MECYTSRAWKCKCGLAAREGGFFSCWHSCKKCATITFMKLLGSVVLIATLWTTAVAQMPPSYYGLAPTPPPMASPDNAIEPPAGVLAVMSVPVPPPPPPLPPPPPAEMYASYFAMPLPPELTLDTDDLGPVVITRVVTRTCYRDNYYANGHRYYHGRMHCSEPQ